MVYEPYRALEGLQGVGFQGKNCLTKWSQTSLKSILALHNIKNGLKMNRKYYYDILVSKRDNAQLIRESTRLACVQLKERDFEKTSLTKVMEIFNNQYAKISFRGMCKKY